MGNPESKNKPTEEVKKADQATNEDFIKHYKEEIKVKEVALGAKKSKLLEAKKDQKDADINEKFSYEFNSIPPYGPLKGKEVTATSKEKLSNSVEQHPLSVGEKAQNDYSKALGDKLNLEAESVLKTGSLDGLKIEQKKAIKAELVRKSITIESIPDATRTQIAEDLSGKDPKFKGLPDAEKNAKILAEVTKPADIQKKIDAFENAKIAEQMKNPAIPLTAEKVDELAKTNLGLKLFSAQQKEALTLDVLKTGNTTKYGNESGLDIAKRVLTENALNDYLKTVGTGNFDFGKLPSNIKSSIFLSQNFEVPESIKSNVDSIKLALKNGEIPVNRGDFPDTPEGLKEYQKALQKFAQDYTGTNTNDLAHMIESLGGGIDREQLSPLVRFLMDLFSGIGAALEESGVIQGTAWRDYVAQNRGSAQDYDHMNSIGGVEGAEFENNGPGITGQDMVDTAWNEYHGWPYKYGADGSSKGAGIDCSQLVVNTLIKKGCLPKGFDTTARGFASQSEKVGDGDGKIGDFLIRTEGGPHIAIISGPRNKDGSYPTVEATSRNKNGSGVIKTDRIPSSNGFSVYKNPFIIGNQVSVSNNYEGFEPSGDFARTDGKITTYQQYGDTTPDKYSSKGIGSFGRLRYGDLAISRDIESQFHKMGIRPGQPVALKLADGSTIITRWMDRTSRSLSGRFDIFQKSGAHPKQDIHVVGINTNVNKKESTGGH